MEAAHLSAGQAEPRVEQPIRAAELVGALSLATDLGTGQPLEHALRTAVLAVRLAELAGASPDEVRDAYYVALLHGSGCTSNGHEAAQLFGEDIEHRAAFFLVDPADVNQVVAFYRAHVAPGRPPEVREQIIEAALSNPVRAAESFAAMCEVAQRFAGWLDLGSGVTTALEFVFARWDGKGWPRNVGDDALPLSVRVLHVARDFSLFLTAGGRDDARAVLERRAGEAYEPRLVELALKDFDDALSELDETRMWQHALEQRAVSAAHLSEDGIDAGFGAVAALTNLKSPWLREHSTNVADIAEAAAWRCSCRRRPSHICGARRSRTTSAESACRTGSGRSPGRSGSASGNASACIRTSRSVHSRSRRRSRRSGSWPAPTTSGSTAPGITEACAGRRSMQSARVLAAADCYSAMREARPHRPALEPEAAEAELTREVTEGRLDRDAVEAVLAAAGHHVARRPRELPAGLTQRELEVLLALVIGLSNQGIADSLGISAKTVGHHVQHVYQKAGVRSRAAATVWAFEHELVHGPL